MNNKDLTEVQKLREAVKSLARVFGRRKPPTVGIVLGSGMGAIVQKVRHAVSIPFANIPHFPQPEGGGKVEGHGHQLTFGRIGRTSVVIQEGRVHPYEGITLKEAVFLTRLMVKLGARTLIYTHAVGAMSKNYEPGEFVAVRDHIGPHNDSPLVGRNEDELGPRFPDMGVAYDPKLIALAIRCALREKVILHRGVSFFHRGSAYETPAEIEEMRRLGGDVATMSTVYEVVAARHMGARVLDIALITNMAAGVVPATELDHGEVIAAAGRLAEQLVRLLAAIVNEMAKEVRKPSDRKGQRKGK